MSKTQYVDTALLNEYIEKSGLKIGYIVDQMGISRAAFDKKRNGAISFKGSEVYVICDLCRIPDYDKVKIFLP